MDNVIFLPTNFTEVLFKMAQLQTLLQLGVVTLPEVVKRRLRFIQLTEKSERGQDIYLLLFIVGFVCVWLCTSAQ